MGVKLEQVPWATPNMTASPPIIGMELMTRSALPVLVIVRVRITGSTVNNGFTKGNLVDRSQGNNRYRVDSRSPQVVAEIHIVAEPFSGSIWIG